MYIVEIDGKTYPMKYGHMALRTYMKKYNLKRFIDLEKLPQQLTVEDMPGFVKAGFDTAAKILDSSPPFSEAEINDLLEKHLWLELATMEAFAESINRPKAAQEESEGEAVTPEPEAVGN